MATAAERAYDATAYIIDGRGDIDVSRNAVAEHALHTNGGMEGFGRLVDATIARLRDRLERERESRERVEGRAAAAHEDAMVAQRRERANLAAFYELAILAEAAGVTKEQFEEIEGKRRRWSLNAELTGEGLFPPESYTAFDVARAIDAAVTPRVSDPLALIGHVGDHGEYPTTSADELRELQDVPEADRG